MRASRSGVISCFVLFAFLTACGQKAAVENDAAPEAESATHRVSLKPADAARLGITVNDVSAAQYTPQMRGYGMVMALDAIAQAEADIQTASAAARQSAASAAREHNLAKSNATTAEALDIADKQAATDAASLALARRRQIATFGQAAPWRSAGDTTLARIANGRTVVMRATFPLGILKNGIPAQLLVTRLDAATETKPWHTTRIWNAPADASIPGRSLFALIDDSGLVDGERVLVSAPVGASLSGVSIPFDAVVISEGAAWFYRALPDGAYERLPLDTTKTLPGGYFVKDGVHAGDKVVTGGTGLLLARETGGSSGEE